MGMNAMQDNENGLAQKVDVGMVDVWILNGDNEDEGQRSARWGPKERGRFP